MPGSRASVFGEAEDFQAALSAEGVAGVLVIGRGPFRARMTQVGLDSLRLAAVEEALARIAFVAVPAGMVLIAFRIDGGPSPLWGGMELRRGEIITFGSNERLHATTTGPSHWHSIQVPQPQLIHYRGALSGVEFAVPHAAQWRPVPAALRQLRQLHRAAIRMAEARAGALTDLQAAHGLEQQLLHALSECLSEEAEEESASGRRHRDILARFEDLLATEPFPPMANICATLDVSERLLRACCKQHLRMGPSNYRRLRATQQVYNALRSGKPDDASVAEIARRHGFTDLGRLAANYRALYGELPSATLRRASQAGVAELTLGRTRMKIS